MLIKKYGNRRLYDTGQSRYITLEDLADLIRRGEGDDVRVVSATTGEDLTTATLTQIIVESRGAAQLLPVTLLVALIRMGDGALAEFLGSYVGWALQVYEQTRKGVAAMTPFSQLLGAMGLGPVLGVTPSGAAADAPGAPRRRSGARESPPRTARRRQRRR